MNSISIGHWLIFVVYLVVIGVPTAKILMRTGHSRWWVLVFFVPLLNIVALWILAYVRWPAVNRS